MPKCVDPRTMLGHCPEAIARVFSDHVAAYNNLVRLHTAQDQAFVEHLNAWTRQVEAYAQCEVNTLNAEIEGR